MLESVRDLYDCVVHGADGDVGRITDVYFDDSRWIARHVVVATGHWLSRHRVLIPPATLRQTGEDARAFQTALTRLQVERSPEIDTEKPVSREHHIALLRYYGFAYEWSGPVAVDDPGGWEGHGDSHLRSASAVTGYRVHAVDGELGHVEDFLMERESWAIRYVVVDTRNWWPGKRVLVSPTWVEAVRWGKASVHVGLDRAAIESAPAYASPAAVDRAYEARLHEHYGRPRCAGSGLAIRHSHDGCRGQPIGRGKNVWDPVAGGGGGWAHRRERVERAAGERGVDRKVMAECPGVDRARVIGTVSRGGEPRAALRMLDCKT